jgi:hypothetical protein
MQVQVNSDNSVAVTDELSSLVESNVRRVLERFEERLTRVEIHLGDVNSHKGGSQDKRCQIEARPRGLDPLSATDQAGTLEEAVRGAAQKIARVLDSTFGRLADRS